MFVTRLIRSRRHLRAPTGFEHVSAAVVVVSNAAVSAPFLTKRLRSRRPQGLPWVAVDPQPTPAQPGTAFTGIRSFRASFDRTLQRTPELNEYPTSPPSEAPVSALFNLRTIRRRPGTGLFLTASDYIEARTVQPHTATELLRLPKRRRLRYRQPRVDEILFVDKAPGAGEEFESAWRAVTTLFRRDTRRSLGALPIPVIGKLQFPGWKLATAFYRRTTRFTLARLPLLSFFQPKRSDLPSYQSWPTLRRRATAFKPQTTRVPEHITLRVPPDSQGFPAFQWPQIAFRTIRHYVHVALPTFVFGKAPDHIRLGLQPPHYVVGRMTAHGKTVRGTLTLHGRTVDGETTATHGVDGSFDPSEGHEGSVL